MISEVPAVPNMRDLESKKIMIDSYSNVVSKYNEVCSMCSWVSLEIYNLRKARSVLHEMDFVLSIRTKLKDKIDYMATDLKELQKALLEHRMSLEAQLRYYSSVQYILGSPRLSSWEG